MKLYVLKITSCLPSIYANCAYEDNYTAYAMPTFIIPNCRIVYEYFSFHSIANN